MKKILVPTDFSKTAGKALHFALEIAARTGSEITVMHAMGPFEGVNNNVYDAFWIEQYADERTLTIQKWAQKVQLKNPHKMVAVHTRVNIGFTVTEISDMARDQHFDLIVIGATGASGLKTLFLGSIASGVIGQSKVPTLVVPRKGVVKKLSKVVLATDFWSDLDKKSLDVLRSLLGLESAPLDVLHVLESPSQQPDEKKEADFRDKFKDIELRFNYNYSTDVPVGIAHFLGEAKADLICTIAHPHGLIHRFFIQSTSRLLANQTNVPLLVLHD